MSLPIEHVNILNVINAFINFINHDFNYVHPQLTPLPQHGLLVMIFLQSLSQISLVALQFDFFGLLLLLCLET